MNETETLASHAYLVERGVRPLYLSPLGDDFSDLQRLESISAGVIVFAADGVSGYASHEWIVDLLLWARKNAPRQQLDRIQGLLLGYSPDAIEKFGEE
jgi:hypothetical protein